MITTELANHGFPQAKLAEAVHLRDQATLHHTEARLKRNGAFKALTRWLRCAQRTKADIEQAEHSELESGSGPGLGG